MMSYKCALMEIPFGGSKGALVINPYEWGGESELEKITRKIHARIGQKRFNSPFTKCACARYGQW